MSKRRDMFFTLIASVIAVCCACGSEVNTDLILAVSRHMRLHKILILCKVNASISNGIVRTFSKDGRTVSVRQNTHALSSKEIETNNLIICGNDFAQSEIRLMIKLNPAAGVHLPWIILKTLGDSADDLQFRIDQRVFIFDSVSNVLSETYVINNISVQKNLYKFVKSGTDFEVKHLIPGQDFLKRRSNFMGKQLTVMTDMQKPFIIFEVPSNTQDNVLYSKSGDKLLKLDESTTDGLISRLFYNILRREMNFTTTSFVRADRKWGSKDSKGKWNGMVGIKGNYV